MRVLKHRNMGWHLFSTSLCDIEMKPNIWRLEKPTKLIPNLLLFLSRSFKEYPWPWYDIFQYLINITKLYHTFMNRCCRHNCIRIPWSLLEWQSKGFRFNNGISKVSTFNLCNYYLPVNSQQLWSKFNPKTECPILSHINDSVSHMLCSNIYKFQNPITRWKQALHSLTCWCRGGTPTGRTRA